MSKKMKMFTRLLSVILSAVLLIEAVPMQAFALKKNGK